MFSAMLGVTMVVASTASAQDIEPSARLRLQEADQLTAANQWDSAIDVLTQLLQEIETPPTETRTRETMIAAYEKRALASLQVGKEPDARADFAAVLRLEPDRVITGPSPGIVNLFEDVRKMTMARVELEIVPADAAVVVDSAPPSDDRRSAPPTVLRSGSQWLPAGLYRLTAGRAGYESLVQDFDLMVGKPPVRIPITLRRTSAVLFISTMPAGVRVEIDGKVRGVTEPDPAAPERSLRLVVDGVLPRSMPYQLRLLKECHVGRSETLVVTSLEPSLDPERVRDDLDRVYEDVSLRRSFGTITVVADQPGAVVFVDDQPRGPASEPIREVCDGARELEVRAPTGRFSSRVLVEAEKATKVAATLLPAYALLQLAPQGPAAADARVLTRARDALRAKNIQLIPVEATTVGASLPDPASGDSFPRAAEGLMRQLDTQGLAMLAQVPADAEGRDLELRLLARDSSRPDVLRLSLQDQSSVQRAIDRLDAQLVVLRQRLGVETADVLRMDGAVVTTVHPGGPARGLIAQGDVIVGIGAASVSSVQDLKTYVDQTADTTVNVRLRDRVAPVAITLERVPTVVNVNENLTFNLMATDLKTRLGRVEASRATGNGDDRLEQSLRLNLAVAMMAVGNWTAAEQLLSKTSLDNRYGVSRGTVDYLRGLCLKQLGKIPEARALFERAGGDTGALLTDNGPAISYLAKQQLN